jgi:hypothetical protein
MKTIFGGWGCKVSGRALV